jgi:lipopolysaccharide transport system permease protein
MLKELNPKLERTITPPRGMVGINWSELWRYKELLYIFVWRDVKVRYKQTAIGVLWAVFQPLATMVIFTVFFGRIAQIPSDNIPYPIFVYSGLLFWTYYLTALTNATNSLVENENIIKKVYFPRLILPISTAITPTIDFLVSLVVLFGLMAYYQYTPNILGILALPFLVIVSAVAASGLGLFLTSVNVKYRDVRYALPFFIQLLLYVTPVIYPITLVPEKFQWLLYLNPMAGVITVARSLLLGGTSIDWSLVGISVASAIFIFLLGIAYFKKTERFFADVI